MSGPLNSNSEQQSVVYVPVGVPVGIAGVDLREGPASRPAASPRELLNARFLHDRAISKRPGHEASQMISYDDYPQVDTEEVRPWLYGWGDLSYSAYPAAASKPPYFPIQTRGGGVAVLDDKLVGWTGDRLLLHRPGQSKWMDSRGIPAYLPTGTEDRWELGTNQYDFADTCVSDTSTVLVGRRSSRFYVSVRDKSTGAWITRHQELSTGAGVVLGTVVYSNGYFVAMWSTSTQLFYSWALDTNPSVWAAATAWANCSGPFDVEVNSDSSFLVGWRDGTQIKISYWTGRTQSGAPAASGTVLATGANTPIGAVGIARGRDGNLGLVWVAAGGTFAGVYTDGGATLVNTVSVSASVADRVAIAGHWNYDATGRSQFTAFCDTAAVPPTASVVGRQFNSAGTGSAITSRPHSFLSSRAFRVGDNVMVVLKTIPGVFTTQAHHYMVCQPVIANGTQTVIGAWTRGEAAFGFEVQYRVAAVRPEPGQLFGGTATPSTPRWVFSVIRSNVDPNLVYWQPTVVSLDFLPALRWAQYGRCLYFAGSCVQSFDGREVTEAGFLEYPEVTTVASSGSGGALTPGAVRSYRVYAKYRNTEGEVTLSPALTFTAPAVGGGHNNNVVTFTTIASTARNNNVTFDIYGTDTSLGSGSAFYLVAADAVSNNLAATTVSFTDGVGDSSLRIRATDPHAVVLGGAAELEETAPPGCEVIASAKGRLWFSGGSLPRGRVAFSKLRENTEAVGWDDTAGYIDLDATGRPIVSMSGFSDTLVALQADAVYAVAGEGPNNLGQGNFPPPQLILPSAGAVTHEGTTVTEVGLVFWAESGPRLITHGFSVEDISQEVEPLARELGPYVTGAVSVPGVRECRWYTSDGRALMWDYSTKGPLGNRWSVWQPLQVAGACYYPRIRGAVLCQPDGRVLLESEDTFTDGGNHYEMVFRTGDLRPTDLLQGDNRYRRLALAGEFRGDHTACIWTYYDNSPMWSDYFTFNPEDAANGIAVAGWGTGEGTWNTDDTAWISPLSRSPDGVYRWKRRLPRNRAALMSIRVSDGGAPNDTFILNEIAVEMASEVGLSNTPPRTFGGNGGESEV